MVVLLFVRIEEGGVVAIAMGVYRMGTPDMDTTATQSTRKQSMASFMGRRYSTRVQPTLRSFLETPERLQLEPSSSEDDRSSIFTSSSHTLSSDDDACLRELTTRGSCVVDVLPARHSTACCTDASLRQELRKRFNLDDDDDHVAGRHSFARRHSFRRKLEMQAEERVENLALWEETETTTTTTTRTPTHDRAPPSKVTSSNPKSLHRETSRIFLGSGKSLDSLFRKPRKSTSSSFLNGLFSFSTFSFSRRSRKLSSAH